VVGKGEKRFEKEKDEIRIIGSCKMIE